MATVLYGEECASCHGSDLRGTEFAPALTGEAFAGKWHAHPQDRLFDKIKTSMPASAPGSLSDEQYRELTALLWSGGGLAALAAKSASSGTGNGMTEWLHNRDDAASTGYSPLDLINKSNVGQLQIAWRWKSDNFGPTAEYNLEATPLMADGVLYTTAGSRRDVVAIDARTGETLWMYRLDEGERGRNAPRRNSGRGVAYGRIGGAGAIYFVTPGFRLVALDAKTGRPNQGFGQSGIVDLKLQLEQDIDPVTAPIGSSSPPLVMNGVVVVGAALEGGAAPRSMRNVKGYVLAFDARSGKRLWVFHTIPLPGEYGARTWKNGSAAYTGNTGAWTILSGDARRGYVYLPVEEATGDFYGGHRPGNDLFSQSLVCLDVKTGKLVWYFQLVHHDIWDYDPPAPPVLVDVKTRDGVVPLVVEVTKQAFAYVFNRVTGKPIWPIKERRVPRSTVPGESASPTQPFPSKPPAFDRQGVSDSDLDNLTPEIYQESERIVKDYRMGPLYTPPSVLTPTNKGTIVLPGGPGGANWPGAVVDPESGILYVSSMTSPEVRALSHDPALSDMRYVDTGVATLNGPFGLPLLRPPWGRISAIDLSTGELLWQITNGDTPREVRNNPKLKGLSFPPTGVPERARMLVTRSLLFAGEGAGLLTREKIGGPMFRAYDKRTGATVAEFKLPAGATGVPMTYALDGKQYIVIAVGGKNHPAEFVALTVP
jgi:quinoprotein glucose dehydrogenase